MLNYNLTKQPNTIPLDKKEGTSMVYKKYKQRTQIKP